MGYMSSWNANRIIELDDEQTSETDQTETLQLSEEEQAELDAQ